MSGRCLGPEDREVARSAHGGTRSASGWRRQGAPPPLVAPSGRISRRCVQAPALETLYVSVVEEEETKTEAPASADAGMRLGAGARWPGHRSRQVGENVPSSPDPGWPAGVDKTSTPSSRESRSGPARSPRSTRVQRQEQRHDVRALPLKIVVIAEAGDRSPSSPRPAISRKDERQSSHPHQ